MTDEAEKRLSEIEGTVTVEIKNLQPTIKVNVNDPFAIIIAINSLILTAQKEADLTRDEVIDMVDIFSEETKCYICDSKEMADVVGVILKREKE